MNVHVCNPKHSITTFQKDSPLHVSPHVAPREGTNWWSSTPSWLIITGSQFHLFCIVTVVSIFLCRAAGTLAYSPLSTRPLLSNRIRFAHRSWNRRRKRGRPHDDIWSCYPVKHTVRRRRQLVWTCGWSPTSLTCYNVVGPPLGDCKLTAINTGPRLAKIYSYLHDFSSLETEPFLVLLVSKWNNNWNW